MDKLFFWTESLVRKHICPPPSTSTSSLQRLIHPEESHSSSTTSPLACKYKWPLGKQMNAANGLDRKPVNLQPNPVRVKWNPAQLGWPRHGRKEVKDSGNGVQSFHQSYPSQCTVMEACVCVCVCPCFTSHIHHRPLSPRLGKRTGESLEGLGCSAAL